MKKFNCTQQELFAACTIGWDLCARHLDQFTALKPRYNAGYVAAKRQEIADAMTQPGRNRRSAAMELMRQELRRQNDVCLESCLKLKRHMDEVWSGEELKAMLKQAGVDDTREVRRYQYENTQGMMVSAALFIATNKEALTRNLNMSEAFEEQFLATKEAFQDHYQKYLDSTNHATVRSQEVLGVLNGIYQDLSAMFADARVIFRQEPDIQKRFSFELVLSNVRSSGWAGIKGTLSIDGGPYRLLPDLQLRIRETGESTEPDDDGSYSFQQMKAGFYTLELSASGYLPQTIQGVEVNIGAYTQLDLDLQTAAADAPVQPVPEAPDLRDKA